MAKDYRLPNQAALIHDDREVSQAVDDLIEITNALFLYFQHGKDERQEVAKAFDKMQVAAFDAKRHLTRMGIRS